MTVYALTSPQPAGLLEAIRDQASGFLPYYLPPTVVREMRVALPGEPWFPWRKEVEGHKRVDYSALRVERRTRTVSPVLPDQPCPECGGDAVIEFGGEACDFCVEGRVPLPLLITGEQWRWLVHPGALWYSTQPPSTPELVERMERRVAGLAVLDQPDWLPVVTSDEWQDNPDAPDAALAVQLPEADWPFYAIRSNEHLEQWNVTGLFSSPPEPGGFVVDVSGARWLDEPVSTMVCPGGECAEVRRLTEGLPGPSSRTGPDVWPHNMRTRPGSEAAVAAVIRSTYREMSGKVCDCNGSALVPLSPGSGGELAVCEVP